MNIRNIIITAAAGALCGIGAFKALVMLDKRPPAHPAEAAALSQRVSDLALEAKSVDLRKTAAELLAQQAKLKSALSAAQDLPDGLQKATILYGIAAGMEAVSTGFVLSTRSGLATLSEAMKSR